jgi:hypothetical protein
VMPTLLAVILRKVLPMRVVNIIQALRNEHRLEKPEIEGLEFAAAEANNLERSASYCNVPVEDTRGDELDALAQPAEHLSGPRSSRGVYAEREGRKETVSVRLVR